MKKKDEVGRQYYKVRKKDDKEDKEGFVEEAMNKRRNDYFLEECGLDADLIALVSDLFQLPDDNDFNAKYAFAYLTNFNNYLQYRENGISYNEIENLLNG